MSINLNNFKNKKVLVIFPHPDDETVMAGGLIQKLIAIGAKVTVVSLTSGDQGKIYIHGRGQSLSEIRRGEFFKAVQRLGVTSYEIFNFPDGKLKDTKVWQPIVEDYISTYDLVVTYDPSGITGHPDHIALSLFLIKSINKSHAKLLFVSPAGLIKTHFLDPRVRDYATTPNLVLELSLRQRLRKWWALFSHRSQFKLPELILAILASFLPQLEGFSSYNPRITYPHRYIKSDF